MTTDPYPPELRAAYKRLTDTKLRMGLSATEETELGEVRTRINACDRQTSKFADFEQAASLVEQELADLRREIEALPKSSSLQEKR